MRRPQLQGKLVLRAYIQFLEMAPSAQVPDVKRVAIAAFHEDFRDKTVFDRVGRSPFARDHGVVAQVPPEIIREVLRATIQFPLSEHLKGLGIHHEDSSRALAAGRTERAHVYSIRAAVDGVGPGISGPLCEFLRLDGLDDLRLSRVR